MLEYIERSARSRNRSNGHERLYDSWRVVPRRCVSNKDVVCRVDDGDVGGASSVRDGSKGRNGPPGRMKRNRVR